MTADVVSAVVPPARPAGSSDGGPSAPAGAHRPLPMPPLAPMRDRSTVYRTAAVDGDGRVAEAAVIGALGWVAGTPFAR